MQVKTVWIWGGVLKAALVILAAAATSGCLAVLFELSVIEGSAIGLLFGIAAGKFAPLIWPCYRFELR